MKILLLGSFDSPVNSILRDVGDEVVVMSKKISMDYIDQHRPDFLVSHGYGYILSREILDRFKQRAINLHPSLLPWNRGSDPDLWSLIDDTPKGVTIHYMKPEIDAGDILIQEQVEVHELDTLRMYYNRLRDRLARLMQEHWVAIRDGKISPRPQPEGGSYHVSADKDHFIQDIGLNWEMPVADLVQFVREHNIASKQE